MTTPQDERRAEVLATLHAICADVLGADTDALRDETRFVDDLGADSLDTVEIAMACEEAFDLMLDHDAWDRVATLGDAADLILSLRAPG